MILRWEGKLKIQSFSGFRARRDPAARRMEIQMQKKRGHEMETGFGRGITVIKLFGL